MCFPFSPRALGALAAGGVAVLGLAACAGPPHAAKAAAPAVAPAAAAPVATPAVTIENYGFTPGAITVKAGTTVTWTNKDEEPHSVVSADEPMHSPTLAGKDDTFSHTFTKPGRYAYNCGIHPFMHGTVEVTA
jgi:plastocyanin